MAFNDNEEPIGLLSDQEGGLFARADGEWYQITDSNPFFDGAEVVTVSPDFVDFYDTLDGKGSMPTYKQTQPFNQDQA
jgi:hypothetical protein